MGRTSESSLSQLSRRRRKDEEEETDHSPQIRSHTYKAKPQLKIMEVRRYVSIVNIGSRIESRD